jgi:hypothetical protein
MQLSAIQTELTKIDISKAMENAVRVGVFYVDAIECISGYSIGAMGTHIEVPALFATLEEAIESNREISEQYLKDINDGERETGDEWEGAVMICRWDGVSEEMELCDQSGDVVHKEDWKSLSGIA